MEEEYLPPLPPIIIKTLEKTLFCYLATCEGSEPHLSLMNFTFKDGEGLIMSTRTNTKKFQSLIQNPSVAILIHDFQSTAVVPSVSGVGDSSSNSSSVDSTAAISASLPPAAITATTTTPPTTTPTGSCSITVYGKIEVMAGEKAEELRAFHLQKNPNYPQFIVGEDIAILRILPTRARICDIRDKVQDWKSGDSS